MKRKILSMIALFTALTLTACGGTTNNSQQSGSQNQSSQKSTSKTSSSKHTHQWVADPTKQNVPAGCETEGINYFVCDCGQTKEEKVPALGHVFEAAEGDAADLLVHPEIDKGCNTKAYRLDIAQATGWNKATTKWNAKTTDDSNNQVEASWDIEGKIPAGKYSLQLEGLMSYTSHGDRYFYNQWETESSSAQNPDKQSESPFRYYFGIDGGDPINPDTKKTWSELGYEGSNDSGSPKFATIVSELTIAAGAKKFSAFHGDIGYSMIVSRIRLVEIKAAA